MTNLGLGKFLGDAGKPGKPQRANENSRVLFLSFPFEGVFGTIPWSVMGNNLLFFKFCGLQDWEASILAAEGTVAGVFGNIAGGMIADALARRFGYHGRPLSAQITVAIGIPMAPRRKHRPRHVVDLFHVAGVEVPQNTGEKTGAEAPFDCPKGVQLFQVTPQVFLQFYGIPPGSGSFGAYFALIAGFGLLGSWAQSGTNFPILSDIVPPSDRSKAPFLCWC